MRVFSLFFAASFTLFLAFPLGAKEASQDKLQKLQSEMLWQKRNADDLDRRRQETAGSLHELQRRLVDATRALQSKEEEEDQVEGRLDGLMTEISQKSQQLDKSHYELSSLTSVLIRIAQQPPESYFLRAGLTDDHIHRAILARALLPRIEAEEENASRDLAVLSDLSRTAREQKRLVEAAQKNLKSQEASLDQLVQIRQGYLKRTEAQKTAINEQLVSLSSEARDLRQLLSKVAPLGSHLRPGDVFNEELARPVIGPIIRSYGGKDEDGIVSKGLTFKASTGAPVVAPAAGRVVFAGAFRGYGQILILQHKGGYHSFLAGFGRIDAEMGQEVEAGEPLGAMPLKENVEKPELYFEWRRNGEPVNPLEQKFRAKPISN